MRRSAAAGLALVALPVAAHLAFSWAGMAFTDDGVVLAASRRVVRGEVPHLDFVSVRPALSAYLHAPELLAGDHLFLFSRLVVWIEIALAAWAALRIGEIAADRTLPAFAAVAVAATAFALGAHTFPPMAWTTIDGVVLALCGLWLRLSGRPLAGYALMSAAALCKQSFLLVAPGALLLLGDWRSWRAWAGAAAPGVAYGALLVALGGAADAYHQVFALSGHLSIGIVPYKKAATAIGVVAGAAIALGPRRAAAVVAVIGAAYAGWGLVRATFVTKEAFALFGAALGYAAARLGAEGFSFRARAAAATLIVAWCASLSLGYPSPALGLFGALGVLLVGVAPDGRRAAPALVVVLVVVLAAFGYARVAHVYEEPPASELDHALDGRFPGARGIRLDATRHAFALDLENATALAGSRFAILPDLAAYWAGSGAVNPLPLDWPQRFELGGNDPALVERVTRVLDAERGELTVIVQKDRASRLHVERYSTDDPVDEPIVVYVKAHYAKVAETEYFEIYR